MSEHDQTPFGGTFAELRERIQEMDGVIRMWQSDPNALDIPRPDGRGSSGVKGATIRLEKTVTPWLAEIWAAEPSTVDPDCARAIAALDELTNRWEPLAREVRAGVVSEGQNTADNQDPEMVRDFVTCWFGVVASAEPPKKRVIPSPVEFIGVQPPNGMSLHAYIANRCGIKPADVFAYIHPDLAKRKEWNPEEHRDRNEIAKEADNHKLLANVYGLRGRPLHDEAKAEKPVEQRTAVELAAANPSADYRDIAKRLKQPGEWLDQAERRVRQEIADACFVIVRGQGLQPTGRPAAVQEVRKPGQPLNEAIEEALVNNEPVESICARLSVLYGHDVTQQKVYAVRDGASPGDPMPNARKRKAAREEAEMAAA